MGFLPTVTLGYRPDLRPGRRKTALVCAGGGITGAVYEIGALRAIAGALPNFPLTDFDAFVGVSAGAFVAAMLANGIDSEELFRCVAGCATQVENIKRNDIFKLNWGEFAVRTGMAPVVAARVLWTFLKNQNDLTLIDAITMLGDSIPSALLTNSGLEAYLQRNLKGPGRSNDFAQLRRELYLPAVNLDTGARVVFGEQGFCHVPISLAVRASSSLPIAFRPTRIDGADYIDGAVEKNFHLDVAIAHGAELIVCINPLVPLMNDPAQAAVPMFFGSGLFGSGGGRYLSQKGLPTVLDQAFKLILHSRMRSGFEMALQKAPHVDVVMIEPSERDFKMFFYNILRYSARIILAKHGFEGAREIIEANFDDLSRVFAKHDIELSRERMDEIDEALQQDERSLNVAVAALSGKGSGKKKPRGSAPAKQAVAS